MHTTFARGAADAAVCQVCMRALPAHGLTTAPHAQVQVISSCGTRGLCNAASVTTKDETLCPCSQSIRSCISRTQGRLPRCTVRIRVSPLSYPAA